MILTHQINITDLTDQFLTSNHVESDWVCIEVGLIDNINNVVLSHGYFKVWPGHCICNSAWWQLAFFLCQILHVFTAGFGRNFSGLKRHKYINSQLGSISKCSATSCPALVEKQKGKQASWHSHKKTVINQLYGANKSPVFQRGQKVTGAWRACIRVIFWKGGSDGCQDHPVVMDPQGLGLNRGFW